MPNVCWTDYLDNNPEEKINWLRFFKLKKDPRVLPRIGWFLRRYSLDELPQLVECVARRYESGGPAPVSRIIISINSPPAFATCERA